MANLMTASKFVKEEILSELRKGNTEVLKGLPPVIALQCGLTLQDEIGEAEESPINTEAVGKAMLDRLGIKQKEQDK